MSCADWEERIAINEPEDVELERHLKACPSCRQLAAELLSDREALGAAPVFSEADLSAPRIAAVSRIRRQRLLWRAAAGAIAALLMVFVVREPKAETLVWHPAEITAPDMAYHAVRTEAPRQVRRAAVKRKSSQEKPGVVVKIFTDDPNIVIYWITD